MKILMLLLVFLCGCAHIHKTPQELINSSWVANGSFSITYNKKRDSAHFKWAQDGDKYIINVFGPFNIGSVYVIGKLDNVEFWRTKHDVVKASTGEQLMLSQLGWQLPISNIRYWILSLPVPNLKINKQIFDQHGRLIYLEQAGWNIKYLFKSDKLPNVVELTDKKVAIKIIVRF